MEAVKKSRISAGDFFTASRPRCPNPQGSRIIHVVYELVRSAYYPTVKSGHNEREGLIYLGPLYGRDSGASNELRTMDRIGSRCPSLMRSVRGSLGVMLLDPSTGAEE